VIADGRWPGRLCGAWRDPRGRIGTMWARSLQDSESSTRYLYLRGSSRSGLPPYGFSDVLCLPPVERRELTLVEGLIDVHQFQSRGFRTVAAVGGARVRPDTLQRLHRSGVETVVLAFDNDPAGRDGLASVIDAALRVRDVPALRVLEPCRLGVSK